MSSKPNAPSDASAHRQGTRPSAVAGMFYPANPAVLRRDIEGLLSRAGSPRPRARVLGIVSPHAGYTYSGATAAGAYALLKGTDVDTVVVVSPSHREFFEGVSVYPGDAYETPLGTIPVDAPLRAALLEQCDVVLLSERGHREEHAIEVQLPFLQEVLGRFSLLPLVMGHQTRDICYSLGDALGRILAGRRAVLVASTDLSHYHPARIADRLDKVFMDDVEAFDEAKLMDDLEGGVTEACGGGPAVAVLRALHALGAKRVEVVHHCTSGDVTGDDTSVVGYLSAIGYA